MTPLIANILVRGGGAPITRFEVILFLLIAGAVIFEGICEDLLRKWIKRTHGRDWPTVSAVIDAISVTLVESKLPSSGAVHNWPSYLAGISHVRV
jgi:uncharacterized membrane protein HdeD (DUF308 family)